MKKIFLVLLFTACPAFAQLDTSPEAVFLKYAEAARAWDTDIIVSLMHPDALKTVRKSIDNVLTGEKSYQSRIDLLPLFSVSDYDEFKLLNDEVVYKSIIDAAVVNLPHLIDILANSEYEITESLNSGDEMVFIYKINFFIEGNTVSKQTLQRLRLYDGEWRLLLPPDSEVTIANLEALY